MRTIPTLICAALALATNPARAAPLDQEALASCAR